jgi:hypothetical protein
MAEGIHGATWMLARTLRPRQRLAGSYYEAASRSRQKILRRALESVVDPALAHCYQEGIQSSRESDVMREVDDWIKRRHDGVIGWLRALARATRPSIRRA